MRDPDHLFDLFDRLGIKTQSHQHEPAHTVEQGERVWGAIPGIHCKNLFLKDAKSKLWLVVAPIHRAIDLKSLPARIGSARLSFGSPDRLQAALGVMPGSVTPFALINDTETKVNLVLDAWMMDQDILNFHPLRNDRTTSIASTDFLAFLKATGHRPQMVELG